MTHLFVRTYNRHSQQMVYSMPGYNDSIDAIKKCRDDALYHAANLPGEIVEARITDASIEHPGNLEHIQSSFSVMLVRTQNYEWSLEKDER